MPTAVFENCSRKTIIERAALLLISMSLCLMTPSPAIAAITDSDGDGVADTVDCAPQDSRLAYPQRYYYDSDGDQYGDPGRPTDICALAPFPGTVAWANDPNDNDATIIPIPVPAGQRILGLDFQATGASGNWRIDLARKLGVQATTQTLSWSEIETAPGQFAGPQAGLLALIRDSYTPQGLKLNLTVGPLVNGGLTLPADLVPGIANGTLTLGSPQVIQRFNALLDFIHTTLGTLPLSGLEFGQITAADLAAHPDQAFWDGYQALLVAGRDHVRLLWTVNPPTVGLNVDLPILLDPVQRTLLAGIEQASDVIAVDYTPHAADYSVYTTPHIRADIEGVIAAYYPTPIIFHSLGFPSAPQLGSSTTRQAQFYNEFFSVWDQYAALIPFVSFNRLVDAPGPIGATADTAYAVSLGIVEQAAPEAVKTAYKTLHNRVYERGWKPQENTATRSFLLGFTAFPYDQIPGGSPPVAALDQTFAVANAHGDMISLQFDKGVPWNEALTDDFSSPTPPYSNNLLTTWQSYRDRLPLDKTLSVAINPLGIPRTGLAAYWGYGESYILDANLQPSGTGVFMDYEDRLLQAPWSQYALDAPEVKTAFLNYVKRVIDYFHPRYLELGREVNLALADPATFTAYVNLQRYLYEQLRADPAYDHVRLVISFAAEYLMQDEFGTPVLIDGLKDPTLTQLHSDAIRSLAPYTDVIGMALYPVKTRFAANEVPASMIGDLFTTLRQLTDKPIAITETGFPASTFQSPTWQRTFAGSADKQALFLNLLLGEMGQTTGVEYINQFAPTDLTPYMDRLRASSVQTPPYISPALVDFFQIFEFNGIFAIDGTPLAAGALWDSVLAQPLQVLSPAPQTAILSSPNGRLNAHFSIDSAGHLGYALQRDSLDILEASPAGIQVDGIDLGTNIVGLNASPPISHSDRYASYGVHARAEDNYQAYTLQLERLGPGDPTLEMEVRLYDDGLAFRYVIPGTQGTRTIDGESTAWSLPPGSAFWYDDNTGNYEGFYHRSQAGQLSASVGGPITVELANGAGYLALTESDLRNYSGMTFRAELANNRLGAAFLDDAQWPVDAGSTSPWRVAINTPDLNGLVNSDMVANLNPPPDATLFPEGLQTPWIQPGRAVWSWWSDFYSGFDFNRQQQYVDYARQLGFRYSLVDAWWEVGFPANGLDQFQRLAELVNYAATGPNPVGIWVWKNWYELLDPQQRMTFLTAIRQAGAVGVKIDNIFSELSESQLSTRLQEEILRDAAGLGLMVNFHGINKATGLSRSFPNEITREGLLGLELNSLAASFPQPGIVYDGATPEHNTVLPFTRLVAGPGDYTPLTFDPTRTAGTTLVHQLATFGVMTSPLLHMAADPARILAESSIADIVRTIPSTWDETIALPQSAIGKRVVMARRKGNLWFLFILNGDANQTQTLSDLDLGFLGAHLYAADLISDDSTNGYNRQHIARLDRSQSLPVTLSPGGGFVARFTPVAPTSRSFHMGFSNLPYRNDGAGWAETYTHIVNHGDLISHSFQDGIPWPEALLSSRAADYPANLQQFWGILKAADDSAPVGTPRYLMINPIATDYLGLAPYWGPQGNMQLLPAPWDQVAFNDPQVKTAYVNYLIAAIDYFQPQYLAINVEANILLAKRPELWQAFKELNAYAYQTIKQRYPNLTVFSTIHYEHMLGLHRESADFAAATASFYPDALRMEVRELLRNSDLMALSTYPYMVADNPYTINGRPRDDYFQAAYDIARDLNLPLAIDQTGYISQNLDYAPLQTTLPGSEQQQRDFIEFLLGEAAAHDFAFVSYFVAQDYGQYYGTDPTTMAWAYTGLFTQNGQAKQALSAWDAYYRKPLIPAANATPTGIRLAGNVQYVWHDDSHIYLILENGFTARVDLMDEDIARVRIDAGGYPADWVSGAIEPAGLNPPVNSRITTTATEIVADTAQLHLRIERQPFRVIAERPDGTSIDSDLNDGIGYDDGQQVIYTRKAAPSGERYLGLGLRGGPLDRRGQVMVMRNTDHFGYGEFTGPLYSSTPFYYGEQNGRFYGLFVDSPTEPFFDLDSKGDGSVLIGSHQTELDYYLFSGPTPQTVANGYARLTGFVPMPPLWALGFHQSRYGYRSWTEIRQVADTFRSQNIPVDAVYLDLDYMNQLNWFSWDPLNFADPLTNNAYLEQLGIKRVNILDPTIQPDDPSYNYLAQSHYFLEDSAGQPVLGNIFLPFGDVSWFDYTKPEAGQFYVNLLKAFLQTGISGIWNDINEPASNYMPQAIYDFGGQKRTDQQARNLYALNNVRLTRKAMLDLRPNERPFILARSGYSGSQRYNANWSGDSLSTFDSLRVSIQNSLHMSLSGMLLFGHDIGGFLGTPDPELFARWFQFASFNPYFRNHAVNTSGPSEPWVYGEPYTSIIRDAINERYRLLPYFYTLMEQANRTAEPILAPLFFHFSNDPQTYLQDNEFLIGDSLLVAPVYTAGATTRTLYLPSGDDWYDERNDQRYAGGQTVTVTAPLSEIPVFVRAGAIIPRGPIKQYVTEPVAGGMQIDLYPGADRTQNLYEDDGVSYNFRQGDYLRTTLSMTRLAGREQLDISHVAGQRQAGLRDWTVVFHDRVTTPLQVTVSGQAATQVLAATDLATAIGPAWFYDPTAFRLSVRLQRGPFDSSAIVVE